MARITNWNPEDKSFWKVEGKRHAQRNLWISVPSLMMAFIIWQIWSVVSIRLNDIGFAYTDAQLFTLAALPGLVGATLRFIYTFGTGAFGGRNWTVFATGILIIPALGIGFAVQNPETPYWVMVLLAGLCGLGGGNFSSSTANISMFFPKAEKGTALGINGGLGNMGVSVVQFVTPLAIATSTFAFIGGNTEGQVLPDGTQVWLQNAAFVWVIPIVLLTVAAYFGMDNLPNAKQSVAEQFLVLKRKHTWIMTILYVATFGSFIGYSAAFPLVLKNLFPEYIGLAWIGAFLAAAARPVGGWLSDKFGGVLITAISFVVMSIGAIIVIYYTNSLNFTGFLTSFLILFIAAGAGSGSTFQMIPNIFSAKESAPVLGITAAFAAYGSFFIPQLFGWSTSNFGTPINALYIFIVIYILSFILNWYYYQRKNAEVKIK
ncbi:MFS transporter [Bacillus sp. B15-48]|uniref:MFS transporter n=1 Tax=Bacillus sp. B15-48 TaxID=1548601 RepID=UPI0019401334|nr:MFS transporter [Bacillus sp. B15-48]MBM4764219.1 MFS transporter [Bacillus sp. B15-48]